MSLSHPSSCECLDTGLDLFAVPPTQTSIEEGIHVEHFPLAALAEGSPIEFSINGSGDEYIDFHHTYLHVKIKVTQADGTNLAAAAPVAPVNYTLHSLFSQVDVSLNDVLITNASNCYPYRAYFEATLGQSEEVKSSQLTAALYYKDTGGHMNAVNDDNTGFVKRRQFARQSRQIDLIGRLHTDLMTQTRYMLNGVNVKIRLIPSKPTFHLMHDAANAGVKTTFTHASMFVRKVKLNPGILMAHAKALSTSSAKYPINRVVMKTFSIPAGNHGAVQDNLFLNQIPNRLTIGLVPSAGFNGSGTVNPFNFQSGDLNFLALHLDGRQIPSKPLTPDFANHRSIRAFHNTLLSLGHVNKNTACGIDRDDFENGYALYSFDLTPSLLDGQAFELVRTGSLRLEVKMEQPVNQPTMVIIHAENDSVIEITASRQVLTDFSA